MSVCLSGSLMCHPFTIRTGVPQTEVSGTFRLEEKVKASKTRELLRVGRSGRRVEPVRTGMVQHRPRKTPKY